MRWHGATAKVGLVSLLLIGAAGGRFDIDGASAAPNTIATTRAFPASLSTFHGVEIWVNPVSGDDGRTGATRTAALRTVSAAWQRVPAGRTLATGYRIHLTAGQYPVASLPPYWEHRRGTAAAPIILEAADGAHTAVLRGDINMFDVSHFALIGVDIVRRGDAFHCERCDHVLIRHSRLSGGGVAQETVKVNQSSYMFIEGSDVHGAFDNAIDFVAVQYGHISGSRIHGAGDWCMYTKGGSAYLRIYGNNVFDCGTGGITAGQGTGFEYMVAPWLQYEAYGIRITSNVVHDTEGAGLGVNGGYNVLFARNTLYHVGTRSHLVEFVHGSRSCDGDVAACTAHRRQGGWGPIGAGEVPIPNRHVFFYDNVILNPSGVRSQWQHFAVHGPSVPPAGSGAPNPSRADADLRIVANVIWNGSITMPLGFGDGSGCTDTNPTCNRTKVLAANRINTWRPVLRDPLHGDYRLTTASQAAMPASVTPPPFSWADAPAGVSAPSSWP